jgi:hypothetical protein
LLPTRHEIGPNLRRVTAAPTISPWHCPEISERLFILCDTTIEGEPENVRALMAERSREELEALLAEAVTELVGASFRANREIERFERRLAKHRKPS